MKQQRDKQSIERYLLGDLPEDEQVRLEDRAFSEPEYLLAVQAIEKDLIDEYARGELSASDRQKFDEHFLASDERRRKVEFARAFARVSSEYTTAETSAVTPESWWVILRGSLGGRSLALGFSVAALVLLFLVAGLWFLRERTRSQPEQAQNPPTPQASPPIQLNGATPEQLAQNEATPIPTPNKPTLSPEASRPVIASLLLLPGTSRSTENQQQLLIPHAAESAQLRVLVDRAETYKNFRAELRTTAGKPISTQDNLQAHPSRTGRTILLNIPANVLNAGDYELALSGANEQGQLEAIGYYYFKVTKK